MYSCLLFTRKIVRVFEGVDEAIKYKVMKQPPLCGGFIKVRQIQIVWARLWVEFLRQARYG